METTVQKITAGIYQICLPLPFALDHVNCYLLRGDDGWTVLDAGLNTPANQAGWQHAFTQLDISPGDVRQIILTHSHPDHYGLAGWLQQLCDAPVFLSPREAELARVVWEAGNLHQAMFAMLGRAGVPDETNRGATQATQKMRRLTLPHPQAQLLEPGATVPVGGRRFQAIHAPGHSDGQLIFYDAADRLLLSGDQVLIKITPNIGLWPMTDPDPLGRYLVSLQELMRLEVRLALPGHGPLITHWHERLTELQQHHAQRLEKMLAAVGAAAVTPYDVSQQIFNHKKLTLHEVRFAVSETLSHLEYLVNQHCLRREENGVWRYRQV